MSWLSDYVQRANASSGYGQEEFQPRESGTWTDVTASRADGTVYQNTTSQKKRRVIVTLDGATAGKLLMAKLLVGSANPPTAEIAATEINVNAAAGEVHSDFLVVEVPYLHYYQLDGQTGAGNTIRQWVELDE